MAQPIEIVIRKTDETSQQTAATTSNQSKKGSSTQQKVLNTALVNAGKQWISYGISQYGNLTGNTIQQRQINTFLNIAGYISEIKAGGWVGTISVATQIGISSINNAIERNRANRQAELLYQRSGNATINGGRGTNE